MGAHDLRSRFAELALLDLVTIAIYFHAVLGIGSYLKRFAKTGEDFFLAGREMTAWVAGGYGNVLEKNNDCLRGLMRSPKVQQRARKNTFTRHYDFLEANGENATS